MLCVYWMISTLMSNIFIQHILKKSGSWACQLPLIQVIIQKGFQKGLCKPVLSVQPWIILIILNVSLPFWQSQITQLVHYVGLQQKPYLSSSGSLFNFGKSTVYLKHWFCKAAKKTRQYASPLQRFGDTERRVRPGTVSVGVHEVCVCSTYNPFLHPTHYTFQLSQPSSITGICLLRIEANRKKEITE